MSPSLVVRLSARLMAASRSAVALSARHCAALVGLVALIAALNAEPALAQKKTGGKGSGGGVTVTPYVLGQDTIPPTVTITPFGGSFSSPTVNVTIGWCDNSSLISTSVVITLDGATQSASYSVGTKTGCTKYATSALTLTLPAGSHTLFASIQDGAGNTGVQSAAFSYTPYRVTVSADSGAVTRGPSVASATTFTVTNVGSLPATYKLSAGCTGAAFAQCAAPDTVYLGSGQGTHVTVTYTTGTTVTSGSISLTAKAKPDTTELGSGSSSVNVAAAAYGVAVAADSASITRASRIDGVQTFRVTNTGNTPTAYNLTVICPTSLFASCSAPSAVQVLQGQTATVTVGYTTSVGASSGTLALQATAQPDGSKNASASTGVTVQEPALAVDATPPGWSTLERSECLTIAIVPGAASQCDGLRLAHPLPSVTTYGKPRTPTLLYDREWIHGMGVSVNVTIPSTEAIPDTVLLAVYQRMPDSSLVLKGTSRFPWGVAGYDRSTRRLARPWVAQTTGVIRYRAEVQFKSGANQPVTKGAVEGEDLEVFRRTGHFGAGWWLAGVEQLVFSQGWASAPSDQVEWIGGDGSVRKYVRQSGSTTVFLSTTPVAGPDTLIKNVNALSSDTAWVRLAGNNVRIYFDNSGQHTRTVNRLGQTTVLTWNGLSSLQLNSIVVPGGLTYTFSYDASGWLDTVSAPGAGSARFTSFTRELVAGAPTVGVRSIRDPDLSSVTFDYEQWDSTAAIGGLTDRRGVHTTLNGEGWGPGLGYASTGIGGGQTVHHTLRNSGNVAMNPNALGTNAALAVAIDSVYTRYTNPRGFVTRFWVNSLGAPTKIINAIGQTTLVRYTDARFPGLATESVSPSGLVTRSWYNVRGLVDSTTIYNPYGDGRNATTKYAWDPKWDVDTAVTLPEGERTSKALDAVTGNVLWAQAGGDTTRFYYDSYGQLDSSRTSDGAVDAYVYDATLRNLQAHKRPLTFSDAYVSDAIGRVVLDSSTTDRTTGTQNHPILIHQTTYDATGRDSVVLTHAGADSLRVTTLYDPESNVLKVIQEALPARAMTLDDTLLRQVTRTYAYDSLGRKVDEYAGATNVDFWIYDPAGNVITGSREFGGDSLTYDALNRPLRRTHGSDSASFTYDVTGGIATANNVDAHVSRSYYPNGSLKGDTISIANTAHSSFGTPYGLAFSYDREGRRTSMQLPSAMAGTQTYAYDPRTGQIATITDKNGTRYRYHYDLRGRIDTLVRRDGLSDQVKEWRTYDLESRIYARSVINFDTDGPNYDPYSRITSNGADSIVYNGLGQATSTTINNIWERFGYDAFGNRLTLVTSGGHASNQSTEYIYDATNGRQRQEHDRYAIHHDTTWHDYNAWGNLSQTTKNQWFVIPQGMNNDDSGYVVTVRTNFYSNGSQMTQSTWYYDTTWVHTVISHYDSAYRNIEQYRYDALGRRIWQRMVRGNGCQSFESSSGCLSTITQTVWDGSEVLLENRTVGDSGYVGGYTGDPFGLVLNVNGTNLDAPLALLKNGGYHDVIPVTDYRGTITTGGCPGTLCNSSDVLFPDEGAFGAPYWPRVSPNYYGAAITGMADGSGYKYRRNRYLDPNTGLFTQEDPLGLGGGLNVYGFGGGDPVSYSDPFGLCIWDLCIAEGIGAVELVAGTAAFIATKLASDNIRSRQWGGSLIPTRGPRPSPEESEANQQQGDLHGCMTCGTRDPGTKTGKWIRNHVPPTSLRMPDEEQQIGPHCQNCSNSQGGTISGWLRQLKDKISPPEKPKQVEPEAGKPS